MWAGVFSPSGPDTLASVSPTQLFLWRHGGKNSVGIFLTLQMKGRWESNINDWFPFMYSQKWNSYFQNIIIMFCLPVPTLDLMNVEIGIDATQFPEMEYINGIFLAVQSNKLTRRTTELVQHYRGSSHRRKGATWHQFDMVWLYRLPIPVLTGRRGVFSPVKRFLHVFAAGRGRGQHPVVFIC
jgi:hypothetical protein